MESHDGSTRISRTLLTIASFVIVVAGLKAAAEIVVPFLFAVFLSIVCSAPMFWLKRRGLPTWFSILLVITGILLGGYMIGALLGSSIDDFSRNLPAYGLKLNRQYNDMLNWLDGRGFDVVKLRPVDLVNAEKAMRLVASLFNGLGAMLGSGALIVLTVIFILLEASSFPLKIRAAFGDPGASLGRMKMITENVKHYLAIKTVMSLASGVLVAIFLTAMGVDYPLLWGFLSFLLNFVPNIGAFIAAAAATLQALIQFGPGMAIGTAAGYAVIEIAMGSFVEPRFMGRELGLSPLVVFLSLVFWGWVLGPIGMILSVVLTVTVKIVLESSEETGWIAVLLGSKAPEPEPETGSGGGKAGIPGQAERHPASRGGEKRLPEDSPGAGDEKTVPPAKE